MLGIREKELYGNDSYEALCSFIGSEAAKIGISIEIIQSNIEGELVNHIHRAYAESFDGIVVNPAAYTHYSIALYDSLKAVNLPAVEVHLTNIASREEYRKKSVTAPACKGIISGFGAYGYKLALDALSKIIKEEKQKYEQPR